MKTTILLKDFGYVVRDGRIVAKAIRGFTSERTIGRCRDERDAVEQLRSIIRSDEFSARASAIGC